MNPPAPLAGAARPLIDASRIWPRLWQGSALATHHDLRRRGFAALVLCAEEYQPDASLFPGLDVIHCPIDDTIEPLDRRSIGLVNRAAGLVAAHLNAGRRVLVTCMQGRNRSGLVSGLALHMLTGMPGAECVRVVRKGRANALTNPAFAEKLGRLRGRAVVARRAHP